MHIDVMLRCMKGQEAAPAQDVAAVQACTDTDLLHAAAAVISAYGYGGLTLVRLAESARTSRMTLHRRGVTLEGVVIGLSLTAAAELREALYPVLTSTQPADVRLQAALDALYDVADRHLPLLAGLFADDDGIFHSEPDSTGALPTDPIFVAPFAKILADGASDGTLRPQQDVTEAATVLFNTAGWGYVQLRHAQRWPPSRARAGVDCLVLKGLRV